jgi:hypothetical protein
MSYFSGLQTILVYIPLYKTQHKWFISHGVTQLFLRIVRERMNHFRWKVDWACGLGVETPGLNDLLTLIVWIFGYGDKLRLDVF